VGLFVNATFEGKQTVMHTEVPASAVLHLHDREWVFVPAGDSSFKRTEVHGGQMHAGGMQEILSGLEPGQKVVSNALSLESTVNQ
jgi:cobalt-zinc-cadmium efflux system membrane fusion protein